MLTNKGRPDPGADQEDEAPDPDKTPFLLKKAKCPICGSRSEQRRFKLKLYSEKNVDLDKHVGSFGWADKDFKDYHPPLYYCWHCPNCHFTESFMDFEEPGKPTWSNFRFLKSAFEEKTQEDPKIEKLVNWLGKGIDYENMNYTQAIRVHLLAIYTQQIIEDKEEQDSLKLGRFYLRTGWLMRELKEKKSRELGTVRSIVSEVRKVWPEVPTSEEDAVKKAIDYLMIAFQRHPGIKNPVAEVDMLMWLAGLQIKLGDEEKGLEWLNQVIQRSTKTNQKIDQRLKNPNIAGAEEHTLVLQQKKISAFSSKARDLLQDIQYKKFQTQKAEAKPIVSQMLKKESPPEAIRAALKKAGFKEKVIAQ